MSLTQYFVIFGLIFIAVGGTMDITQQQHGCGCGVRFLGLSKHHWWTDGIVLLVLAGLIPKLG